MPIPYRLLCFAFTLGAFLASCAKQEPLPPAPEPFFDPSPAYPALSALYTTALATPVLVGPPGPVSNALADGTNAMASLTLAAPGPQRGTCIGCLWLRPSENPGVPAALSAWFADPKPSAVLSMERLLLKLPGGPLRDSLRVRYQPLGAKPADLAHWRFYAINPGDPRMPLLLDGAWKKEVVPDPEHPELGLVESIQDWRTDSSPDWLVGRWSADGSPEGTVAFLFELGACYRYLLPEGGLASGWYVKQGDHTYFLQTGLASPSGPASNQLLGPRRSTIRYNRGRACFFTEPGEAPLPLGCLSPVTGP